MNAEAAMIFHKIPKEFRRHEKTYVMQYEFSGIQDYIFGGVTIASTRAGAAARSEYIVHATDLMESWLRKNLSYFDAFRVLSKSSGKLICAVSHRARLSRLYKLSDRLQRIIYASTDGRLEMFYGICKAEVVTEEESGQKEDAMSVLAKEANRNKYHCVNILGIAPEEYRMDEFVPDRTKDSETDGAAADDPDMSGGIMAAVKFDLDNLGSFFQKINAFDTRKTASECLGNILNSALEEIPGLYPVFTGGDDIFAIAHAENYLTAVCAMHERIKQKIESSEELSLYRSDFGISGGASFIRNDLGKVPLVYYFEESEDKLMRAKSVSGKNVFAVSNCIMTWEQLKTVSNILSEKEHVIMKGLSEEQRYDLYLNVKELKSRILRIHRNTGEKLLTQKEEQDVCNIN